MNLGIVIPVFDDWESCRRLLGALAPSLARASFSRPGSTTIYVVDDGSTQCLDPADLTPGGLAVQLVYLACNMGNQRAIALGLCVAQRNLALDAVAVMDGDGEDRPDELNLLFNKSIENPLKTITADRVKRSEGPLFKLMYLCHKILTYVFTGKLIKFGNYSCLPKAVVLKLIKEASTWSSFSGSLAKTVSDRISIPSVRGQRYFGPSKMNLFNLLMHSFSIIAVFKQTVIIRSILFLILYFVFIYESFSIVTLIPVFIFLIFLFLILKNSSRENIIELDNSLENIINIEVLSNSDGR